MMQILFHDGGGQTAFVDESDGPPVLVIHGFTGSVATMAQLRSHLATSHRVIAADLVGHGNSDCPADASRYSTRMVVSRFEDLLDHLGIPLVDVVGYSLGGRLALSFAAHFPARVHRLALVGTTAGIEDEVARSERRLTDEALASGIEAHGVEAFVDLWERLPIFATQLELPAAVRSDIRRNRLQNSTVGLANSLRGCGAGAMPHLWNSLPMLEHPMLLVAGELDEKYLSLGHRLAAEMPNAELLVAPGVGHAAHIEAPDDVGVAIEEFLSQP